MYEESTHALPLTQLFILYQGNYLKALTCMEQGLVLRQRLFGTNSEEASSCCATMLVVVIKEKLCSQHRSGLRARRLANFATCSQWHTWGTASLKWPRCYWKRQKFCTRSHWLSGLYFFQQHIVSSIVASSSHTSLSKIVTTGRMTTRAKRWHIIILLASTEGMFVVSNGSDYIDTHASDASIVFDRKGKLRSALAYLKKTLRIEAMVCFTLLAK